MEKVFAEKQVCSCELAARESFINLRLCEEKNYENFSFTLSFFASEDVWETQPFYVTRKDVEQSMPFDFEHFWGIESILRHGSSTFYKCVSKPDKRRPRTEQQEAVAGDLSHALLDSFDDLRSAALELMSWHDMANGIKASEDEKDAEIQQLKAALAVAEKKADENSFDNLVVKSVADQLTPAIRAKVAEQIGSFADAIPTRLEVKIGEALNTTDAAVRHKKFEQVLKFVAAGQPVWLVGEAGTGKSQLCEQIAQALGAQYRCVNSVLDEYAGLKGFVDANGRKHGTQFTEALDLAKMGVDVVLCIDEADNSIPEVFLVLNGLLSGGTIECMGEPYKMNDHLHIVACGNTAGRGGSNSYTRSIIDQATLDRFTFVEVDYDPAIELSCAGGNEELARFCHQLRETARTCGIDLLITYRAIKRLKVNEELVGIKEAIKTGVVRGLDEADLALLKNAMDGKAATRYVEALVA